MVDNESDLETHTTTKMKLFVTVAKSYKSLAVVTKNSI